MHGRITVFFGEHPELLVDWPALKCSQDIGASHPSRTGWDRSPLTSQAHFEFVTFEETERMSARQSMCVCEGSSCLQVIATRTSPERGHCVARIKSGVRIPPSHLAGALFVKDAFGHPVTGV